MQKYTIWKSKHIAINLKQKRLVYVEQAKIDEAVNIVAGVEVKEGDTNLDPKDLKAKALAALNSIPDIDKNSDQYKKAVEQINAKTVQLEKTKTYITARTTLLTTNIIPQFEKGVTKDQVSAAVKAQTDIDKLVKLQAEAGIQESDPSFQWLDRKAMIAGVLSDYYNSVALDCNKAYQTASIFAQKAMDGTLTSEELSGWQVQMNAYKTYVEEYRVHQSKNWPGTENFQLNANAVSVDTNYDTVYNYFEAYKSSDTAKKTGDKEGLEKAKSWLTGAEQKQRAIAKYNECRAEANNAKLLLSNQNLPIDPADPAFPADLKSILDEAGGMFQEAIAALDKSDWKIATTKFSEVLVKYKDVSSKITAIKNGAEANVIADARKLQIDFSKRYKALPATVQTVLSTKMSVPPGIPTEITDDLSDSAAKLARDYYQSRVKMVESYKGAYGKAYADLYAHAKTGAGLAAKKDEERQGHIRDYASDASTLNGVASTFGVPMEDVVKMTAGMNFRFNIEGGSVVVQYSGGADGGKLQANYWFSDKKENDTPVPENKKEQGPLVA